MDTPSKSMRDLARRLLAIEAANNSGSHPHAQEALRVQEKLRISLTRFAGAEGFSALMRRSLALARLEAPSLQAISVQADGVVLGLEELPDEAAEALTSHLLALLVIFIGEPLTLRLIKDAWPELSLET